VTTSNLYSASILHASLGKPSPRHDLRESERRPLLHVSQPRTSPTRNPGKIVTTRTRVLAPPHRPEAALQPSAFNLIIPLLLYTHYYHHFIAILDSWNLSSPLVYQHSSPTTRTAGSPGSRYHLGQHLGSLAIQLLRPTSSQAISVPISKRFQSFVFFHTFSVTSLPSVPPV